MKDFFKKYDYLFFDFDGVIVDSVNIKTKAFAKLFELYGDEVVKKVIDYHLKNGGVSRYDKFRYYYKNFLKKEISEEELKFLDKQFSEVVYQEILKAPYIEGVIDFLNICLENKKIMFIISATPQKEIRKIVNNKSLKKYFKDVVGSPATKKENLCFLFKKYNIDYNRSVYFGDSSSDKDAAKDKNILFLGINFYDKGEGFKNFKDLLKIIL